MSANGGRLSAQLPHQGRGSLVAPHGACWSYAGLAWPRYTIVTPSLHHRYTIVTPPLHHRYTLRGPRLATAQRALRVRQDDGLVEDVQGGVQPARVKVVRSRLLQQQDAASI